MRVKPGQEGRTNPVRNALRIKKTPFALNCYDGIRTGPSSRVKIKILKGALTLGPNSQVLIENYLRKTRDVETLSMLYGKIRAVIDPKQNKKKSFRIKTPSSVAGVRGTDFYIEFDPNKNVTKQATLTGKVEVEQVGSKQKVVVESGNQVEVKKVVLPQAPKKAKVEKSNEGKVATSLPAKKVKQEAPVFVEPVVVEPLKVTRIEETVKKQIRSTSTIVKNDKDFTSEKAVEILGKPEDWKPTKDEVPLDFQEIENVF